MQTLTGFCPLSSAFLKVLLRYDLTQHRCAPVSFEYFSPADFWQTAAGLCSSAKFEHC